MKTFSLRLLCPDIKTQDDATIIKETLASSPGVDTVDVDLHTHTVSVLTANEDAGDDVCRRLADAGYPVED